MWGLLFVYSKMKIVKRLFQKLKAIKNHDSEFITTIYRLLTPLCEAYYYGLLLWLEQKPILFDRYYVTTIPGAVTDRQRDRQK